MEVVYDEFRTDDTVVENANTTGSAQVIKQNTRATVEDDDAFVRLGLENPNSYAVAFEVQLSEEIVRPATLGTVRATDTDGVTADWQAQHDFEAEETHTRVTVVVPAETDVLFTPSQLRVKSLSWTGEAEQSAETLRERVTTLWEDDRLEQRTYQVTGSEGGSSRSTSKTGDGRPDRGVARHLHARRRRSGETHPLAEGRVSRCSTGRSRTMTAPWTRFRSPSTRPAPSRSLSNRRPPRSSDSR